MTEPRCVLFHDNFQNFKSYNIPKAQLVIADIPYNIGSDFYASRPDWYVDGDNRNGESMFMRVTQRAKFLKFLAFRSLQFIRESRKSLYF